MIWLFSGAPLELSPVYLKSLFLIGGELARGVVKSMGLLSSAATSSVNIGVFPSGFRLSSSCPVFSSAFLDFAPTITPFFFRFLGPLLIPVRVNGEALGHSVKPQPY